MSATMTPESSPGRLPIAQSPQTARATEISPCAKQSLPPAILSSDVARNSSVDDVHGIPSAQCSSRSPIATKKRSATKIKAAETFPQAMVQEASYKSQKSYLVMLTFLEVRTFRRSEVPIK